MELGADNKHYWGGEDELEPPKSVAINPSEHGDDHRRKGEYGREPEPAPLGLLLGAVALSRSGVVGGVGYREAVSDSRNCLDQIAGPWCRRSHPGPGGGQVDDGTLHSRLSGEDPFDARRARGTSHPFDIEGEGFRLLVGYRATS
jgi:hypothetical protein